MPTLNAYKNDPGYYIRAWTTDLGNINYKLHGGGAEVIETFGLSDGDDISWATIQTLRAAGELYTDESGTLGPDDVIPPDGSAKELSAAQAEELLEVILDLSNLSQDQLADICDILGVDIPDSTEQQLEQSLETRLSGAGLDRLQTGLTLNGDPENSTVSVDIQDVRADGETTHLYRIAIFQLGDVDREDPGMARHDIIICQEHGLEAWNFVVSGESTWHKQAEMAQQKSCLMPAVISWLADHDISLKSPDEAFGTKMQQMS